MTHTDYPELHLLVNGERMYGSSRDKCEVRDPANGALLGLLPIATTADIDLAVEAAAQAAPAWRRTPAHERARILLSIASKLRERTSALARILTREQGKTLREAAGEIGAAADTFEWMAEEGKRAYGRTVPSRLKGTEQIVQFEPVGPVAAFSPWNFPAVLAARKVAAALAAGCTVVLKPAEETPGIMLQIASICVECGLPDGVLNILYGEPSVISSRLIDAASIAKISFTGSVPVGRRLSALAGAQMKKITLELGGHAPVLIDGDVDPVEVARLAAAAKFRNAGQLCHAPTRFVVHESIANRFTHALAEIAGTLKLGHGLAADTQMGPVTHSRRLQAMQEFCDDAAAKGARIVSGGRAAGIGGLFFEPTVIAGAGPALKAMREEPFGPLALVSTFNKIEEAIALANSVDLGLGAYAFTRSYETARLIQQEVECGSISFNTFSITPPEMPFTGWKQSGMGSEMGLEGLREYLKPKAIIRAPALAAP